MSPKPGPHVDNSLQSAQFYLNKILKDHKGDEYVLMVLSVIGQGGVCVPLAFGVV